jgi:hypothetical protein
MFKPPGITWDAFIRHSKGGESGEHCFGDAGTPQVQRSRGSECPRAAGIRWWGRSAG